MLLLVPVPEDIKMSMGHSLVSFGSNRIGRVKINYPRQGEPHISLNYPNKHFLNVRQS